MMDRFLQTRRFLQMRTALEKRVAGLAILAGACGIAMAATTGAAAADRDFGASVRHNMAAQTVNPAPVHDGELEPGGTGLRNVLTTRRYMLDQVKPLPSLNLGDAPGSMGEERASENGITGQGK